MKKSYIKDFAVQNPIATVAIVGVVGFFGYRGVKKLLRPKPEIPVVPPIPTPGTTPGGKGARTNYTYGAQQYSDYADLLFRAFDSPSYDPTDEKAIANVMSKMKSYDDVLALIDSYGKRSQKTWYGGETDPMSLSETIYDELSAPDIEKYVNTPLKRTGYKF